MLRRDFLTLTAVGICSAAGVAHAAERNSLTGVAVAHASVAAGLDTLPVAISPRVLRDAAVTRRYVVADQYFASFGLRAADAGILDRRVTILSTPFPDALAEVIVADRKLFVIWDGVLYRLEVAP